MNLPFRTKVNHRSPEWIEVPVYFITICTQERGCNQLCTESAPKILQSVQFYHEKERWYCEFMVLMPDHVHFLLSFRNDEVYQRIIGDWKRWITRHYGIQWQENFFEHRLRREESLDQKARYLEGNPVRAGLVTDAKDWPYFWQPGWNSVARRSTATAASHR